MKELRFLFAIFITLNNCLSQDVVMNRQFPFLMDSTYNNLIQKKDVFISYGCMGEHTTVGELELQRILSDTTITDANKYNLLESLILTDTLYHLHNLAGQVFQYNDSLKLSIRKNVISNYLILRSILSVEDEIYLHL